MKILVVDDSILIRRSLIKLLDQLDDSLQIAEAVNVPEGIRMAKDFKPEIVIIDIRMPGGSGLDILKELKGMKEKPVTIVLTKYCSEKFQEEAAKSGADYFFDKSTEFEKVIEVVESHKKK